MEFTSNQQSWCHYASLAEGNAVPALYLFVPFCQRITRTSAWILQLYCWNQEDYQHMHRWFCSNCRTRSRCLILGPIGRVAGWRVSVLYCASAMPRAVCFIANMELILTQELSDAICDSLGVSGIPINPVFAMCIGIYWIHDPRFVSHRVLCGAIKCVLGIALILVFLLSLTGNHLQRGRVEMVDWGAKASGSVNEHWFWYVIASSL